MRLLPTTLTAILLLGAASPFALAQNHASGVKRSSTVKSHGPAMSHHKNSSNVELNAGAKHGVTEELTKLEHQPLPQSSVAAAHPKAAPVLLPKMNSDKKGKSAIKVSGRSQKGMTATRRSAAPGPRR